MADQATCRLCGSYNALIQSHLIPKFVFDRQKEGSSTGYLRFAQRPNRRLQDGPKLPFLCDSCERRFNQWETPFASKFFHPFHERRSPPFEYGPWMAKCGVSIVWRALTHLFELGCDQKLSPNLVNEAQQALAVWKAFLDDHRSNLGPHDLHFIPLDTIQESTTNDWPEKINRYFLCTSEIDMLSSESTAVVLVKMLRCVLIGFIREPENNLWHGTRVELTAGQIAPCRLSIPDWLGTYFRQRAERLAQWDGSISEKQKRKIETAQSAQKERILNSEDMRAFLADQENGD